MKVFVITKKTLLMIAAVILALIAAAVVIAATAGGEGDNGERAVSAEPHEYRSAVSGEGVPVSGGLLSFAEEYERDVLTVSKRELPVYSVDRNDKCIALTIDAAWDDDKTPFILQTLDRYGIKATFFLCGFWAKAYPEQVKAIHASGHSIGNHSMTHPHMTKLSEQETRKEIADLDDLLESITGERTKLFRAPYGEYDDRVISSVRASGHEPIQWDIDTIDWKPERSSQTILNTVLPKLKDGSIILCHNNGYKIEEYLPTLIETAQANGFRFVTVDELLLSGDTMIDVNGVQKLK